MNKMKFYIVLVIVLLLINMALVVFYIGSRSEGKRPPKPREVIIDRLKLDDDQVARYDELIHWHRSNADAKLRAIQQYKSRLYASLNKSPDSTGINALTDSIALAHKQLEYIHYKHFTDIRQLCRPDQQEAFRKLSRDLAKLFHGNGPPPR